MQEFTRSEVYEYLCKFKQILTNMKNRMFANCPSDSITDYFIKCMIPHHEAAIYMCQNLLKYTRI